MIAPFAMRSCEMVCRLKVYHLLRFKMKGFRRLLRRAFKEDEESRPRRVARGVDPIRRTSSSSVRAWSSPFGRSTLTGDDPWFR